MRRPKVVYDPIVGVIDIDSVVAMVDAPPFQLLRYKQQLSLSDLAFPGARHTRFEHSLGAFAETRRLADRWLRQGMIDYETRRALMGYALYHDIGHAAFSHATEDFAGDHKLRTIEIALMLRREIENSNINFDLMMSFLTRRNPLHAAVSDKNIGIEKLDYLERDGWYTGVGRPTGVEYVRKFLYFWDNQIAIDEKMADHVVDTLNFYQQMYKHVYLRKCLVIAQRMFHKMLALAIHAGEIDAWQLSSMTDSEVLGKFANTRVPDVAILYQRLLTRRLLKEAVVIRNEDYVSETRVVEKEICVIGVTSVRENMLASSPLLQKNQHEQLDALERKIGIAFGIAPPDVLVVPAFYADRFVSQDVFIRGSDAKLHSLRARRPEAFASMEATARMYSAIRICVPQEHRERVCAGAQDVLALIEDFVR